MESPRPFVSSTLHGVFPAGVILVCSAFAVVDSKHFNLVPLGCYGFFPCHDFTGLGEVVGLKEAARFASGS